MNRIQQSDYLINHPSFKQAINNFNEGHPEDIRDILCILLKEVEDKTKIASSRCCGKNIAMNKSDIKIAIIEQEKIDSFDYKPPFIKACDKLTFQRKVINKIKSYVPHNQLSLFMSVA